MPTDPSLIANVEALLDDPAAAERLAALLVAESRLPGPRANLELLDRVASLAGSRPALVPLLLEWLALETPPGDPREYLSCVAAVSLGALVAGDAAPDPAALIRALRAAANDGRWRVREGVAMALQRIGEASFSALMAILEEWLPDATPLERRAIVAALAHPPLLRDPARAAAALDLGGRVALTLRAATPTDRKTDQVKTLAQGLGYALSVLVAPLPEPGFALLERLVETGDPLLVRVVRDNLGKNRIAKPYPERVAALRGRIDAARG